MTTNINLEKLIPSFGSEILDALYSESTIVEASFDDFLNLPVKEGYEPNKDSKIELAQTEDKVPDLSLGVKPELLESENDLQFEINDIDLYKK